MNNLYGNVLLVDDDENFKQLLEYNLSKEGYSIMKASNGEDALSMIEKHAPDIILLDLKMKGMGGMETLNKIKEFDRNLPVIMITGHGDTETAVTAMKLGAYDFVSKPLKPDEISVTVRNALANRGLLKEVKDLKSQLKARYDFKQMIGSSGKMQDVFRVMEKAVDYMVTVLIQGESGTGKELVARAIHYNGPRKDKPLVVVNCAAIPEALLESELFGFEKGAFTGAFDRREGKFEQADGGTIFLDEIGEMSPLTQAKVLRVLENKEIERLGGHERVKVDVRIISATNKDLAKEVRDGRFREDLYYRLMVFPIILPLLKDRKEDIPSLVSHFINIYGRSSGKEIKHISSEAMDFLINYSWPGNIRELENIIERAVVLCSGDTVTLGHMPVGLGPLSKEGRSSSFPGELATQKILSLENMEAQALRGALDIAGHNISRAAKELGISRATFYRKAKRFGIL